MAVAVKLSRKLFETLGDEAAEAMVGWMESVERNRAELREISDMAFARIDARFGQAEARFGQMESRFEALLDRRLTVLRDELRDEMHAGFARLDATISNVEMKIDQRFADLLKWSFTFWVGSTLTLMGALVVLSRLSH
ncbi:MAG: hypothetical protein ACRENQ_01110 [Gemmatimonadaceae bacterium]